MYCTSVRHGLPTSEAGSPFAYKPLFRVLKVWAYVMFRTELCA
jgi:hypothetical protein